MKIQEMKVSEIVPYENNPRKNDAAVQAVANSIKEFGFRVPLFIDKEHVIIAGHTRLKAAIMLGLKKVPVIIADDLTEEQANAYRLVDNKTSEAADWDLEKLKEELAQIKGINMEDFAFMDETAINYDEFFEEAETPEKEPKKCTCPFCNFEFERPTK